MATKEGGSFLGHHNGKVAVKDGLTINTESVFQHV